MYLYVTNNLIIFVNVMCCECGTTWRCLWLFFTGENASSLLVTDCWSPQKGPAVWISRACCCCGISVRSVCSFINWFFYLQHLQPALEEFYEIDIFLLCLLLIESRLTNLSLHVIPWLTYTSYLLHIKHLLKKNVECESKNNIFLRQKNWI